MRNIFFFFSILFFCQLTWAEDKLLPLLVKEAVVEGKNKQFYQLQLRKIVLETIRKNGKYEIFLSTTPKNKNGPIYFIESLVSLKDDGQYLIEIKLISGKSQLVIREAWAALVPERFVLLQGRLCLVEVLYGPGMARKLKQSLMEANPEFSEYLANEDLASSLDNKELPSFLKNTQGSQSQAKMVKSLTQLKTSIQKDLEAQSKEAIDDPSSDEEPQDSESDQNPSAFVGEVVKKNETTSTKGSRPRVSHFLADIVYLNRSLETNYLIRTVNNLNYIGPRFTYRKSLSDYNADEFIFSAMNLRPWKFNETEFDVPDLRNIYAQYLNSSQVLPFDVILGIHYDNQIFINISEFNGGLKISENHLVWTQIGVERTFNLSLFSISFQALYAQNIYSQSNFIKKKDIKLDATRYSLGSEILYKKLRFGLYVSREEINSRSLKNFGITQDSFFSNFAYAF